jgi:hypothetical protein
MADEKGETRRQRNARFDEPSPEIDVPPEGEHVWGWFWELSHRRGTGPEALTFGEVAAWRRLTGQDVEPAEVEMIMAMDDAYLRAVREDQAAARERALQSANAGR